ncbi:GspH/FimT family pseudopilin [Rhodococcus sp. IEGM1300]
MRQQGFSLIELLMGLAIAAIVLHLATPAFAALTESNHREEAAWSIVSGIRSARSEAITRNQTIVIHATNDDWSQGWRMIADVSGKGHEDSDNPLLLERQSNTQVPIFGNGPVKTAIRFNHLGKPLLDEGGFRAGTLHVCATRGPVSELQVVLAASGRVSLRSKKTAQALCERGKKLKAASAHAAL